MRVFKVLKTSIFKFQVGFWIFRARFVEIILRESTITYSLAMVVLDSSNDQFVEIDNTLAKLKKKEAALLIKHTEINAELVVCKNAKKQG